MGNDRRDDDYKEDKGLAQRVLMSLVVDITQLHETVERVKVEVYTMAKEAGVIKSDVK